MLIISLIYSLVPLYIIYLLLGQTLPSPKGREFKAGTLLGSVSGELGLRKFLESNGHTLVVTSDKEGPNCTFEKELVDADGTLLHMFVKIMSKWNAYAYLITTFQIRTYNSYFL